MYFTTRSVRYFAKLAIWQGLRNAFVKGRREEQKKANRRWTLHIPSDAAAALKDSLPQTSSSDSFSSDRKITRKSSVNTNIPQLPAEVWRRVLSYVVRLTGAISTELEEPFGSPHADEEFPDADPQIFDDRRSLLLVCKTWRDMVSELSAEYIVIYSQKQLLHTIKTLEAGARRRKKTGGKSLGDWTTRLELKISSSYCGDDVVRLLRLVPNLLIFINQNGSTYYAERKTPREVIEALVKYCGHSLKRIDWSGPGESPTYDDLVHLTAGCPDLTTLRLTCIYTYPSPDEHTPALTLPKLKSLSLGFIPERSEHHPPDFSYTWNPFLYLLALRDCALPHLERLDIELFPIYYHPFFVAHGSKIRTLRLSTWSTGKVLHEALAYFPHVENLVFSHGTGAVELPPSLPSLKRLCVISAVEHAVHVPPKVFNYAVLIPLDRLLMAVEYTNAPLLQEIWIRDSGAYVDILEHPNWLQSWWRRWNIRGVQFMNKAGVSFEKVDDEREALLDSVRL